MSAIKLSVLAQMLQNSIENQFGRKIFLVLAETSSLKVYHDRKQVYFNLVEKPQGEGIKAEMSVAGFGKGYQAILDFEKQTGRPLANGMQVLVGVTIDFKPAYGLKLMLQSIDAQYSVGVIERQRQLNIDRLVKENPDAAILRGGVLYTRNKGLRMAAVIKRIAVISTTQAAGYEDFIHGLRKNKFGYQFGIDLYSAKVQGEQHADALVNQMLNIYNSDKNYDVLLIMRGGGNATDLLLFDTYSILRAVARFPIPIITGLGHLRDTTLCDLAAHTALKTPTMVAEFIINYNRSFEEAICQSFEKIKQSTRLSLANASFQLQSCTQQLSFSSKGFLAKRDVSLKNVLAGVQHSARIQIKEQEVMLFNQHQNIIKASINRVNREKLRILETQNNLKINANFKLAECRNQLELLFLKVGQSNPAEIFQKGYVQVIENATWIKRLADLKTDEFELIFSDGSARVKILSKTQK
jgi:exodeoxyribonuclease VII large subunit